MIKVNWLLVAIIVAALLWLFMKPMGKSYYTTSVLEPSELDEVIDPVSTVPSMLPSVAGVSMGSSAYRAKTCSACGI